LVKCTETHNNWNVRFSFQGPSGSAFRRGGQDIRRPTFECQPKIPFGIAFFRFDSRSSTLHDEPRSFPQLVRNGTPTSALAFCDVRQGTTAALLLVKDAPEVHSYLSKVRGAPERPAVDQRSPHALST